MQECSMHFATQVTIDRGKSGTRFMEHGNVATGPKLSRLAFLHHCGNGDIFYTASVAQFHHHFCVHCVEHVWVIEADDGNAIRH